MKRKDNTAHAQFPSRDNQTNKYNQIKNMNIQSIKPETKSKNWNNE